MKVNTETLLSMFGIITMVFLLIVGSVGAYPAGPPPGVTGGFSEPTCNREGCHVTYTLNQGRTAGLGDLVVTGFPKQYEPGKTYPVKITITHDSADRAAFGFQLAARAKKSQAQAGKLQPTGSNTQAVEENGVQYVEQTLEGTLSNVFEFNWVAPATSVGEIVVHAAGNAGNGDGSPEGDYIYATSIDIAPAP
jgi:hypothetical protein